MSYGAKTPRERATAAVPAALVHGLIAWAFLAGFAVELPQAVRERLKLIPVLPEPPATEESVTPPASVPDNDRPLRAADPRPEGAASPRNLESVPTAIVAPEPAVQLPITSPLPAAPRAGPGSDPSAGAARVRGPGTGSGGFGDGTGSGRGGYGGGGGGGGGMRPPRWIRGSLRDSDYPAALGELGVGGTVSVLYAVEPSGRVTDCVVTRSSGNRELDETTCRLIERRFVYEPARDRSGRPIRSGIEENHTWVVEDIEEPPQPPPQRRPRRPRWRF